LSEKGEKKKETEGGEVGVTRVQLVELTLAMVVSCSKKKKGGRRKRRNPLPDPVRGYCYCNMNPSGFLMTRRGFSEERRRWLRLGAVKFIVKLHGGIMKSARI